MMLFAQLPGTDEAIKAAADKGWEAAVLVVLVISGFAFFGYMFRQFSTQSAVREERLAARVTHLEDLIRERLFGTIESNGALISKMVDATVEIVAVCREMRTALAALDSRPCMAMETAERMKLVEAMVEKHENHRRKANPQ
jgi:hypothetical protein